jgi:NAD(P)-dependent dehydrogenase (short-subunit alcohol dehydrogenase family)
MTAKQAQSRSQSGSNAGARLTGKVAVVTGGGSGIGFAIAKALSEEGCSVVIAGRNEKRLASAAKKLNPAGSAQVVAQLCDVRELYSVDELFDSVKSRFGQLEILVNNAGIIHVPTTVDQTSPELWHDIVETNLTGMFLCTRAALPLMSVGGNIINNISAAAKQIFPNIAAYTAAKTGAYGLTLALREELMPRGIRVTALMLGATSTDMWQQIMPEAPRERMIDVDSVGEAVLYTVLLPTNANVSELLITPTFGAM